MSIRFLRENQVSLQEKHISNVSNKTYVKSLNSAARYVRGECGSGELPGWYLFILSGARQTSNEARPFSALLSLILGEFAYRFPRKLKWLERTVEPESVEPEFEIRILIIRGIGATRL